MKVITNVNFGKKEEEGLTFYEPEIIDYVLVTGSPVEINEMMEFMGWLTAGATTRQNAASRYASLCLETLRSTCTSSLARNWLSWKRAPTRNPAPPWFSYLPLQMCAEHRRPFPPECLRASPATSPFACGSQPTRQTLRQK